MLPFIEKRTTEIGSRTSAVRSAPESSRRRFLAGTAGVLAGVGGAAGTVSASESCSVSSFAYTIQANTPYETTVHVIDGRRAGPTAVVVGGIHGDEAAGYEVGARMLDWGLERGRLVVIPEADADAIRRGTRHGRVGHLNRQFPTGSEPLSGLARDVWEVVEMHDPGVVIDMHSSRGIWGAETAFDGYGQAIFSAPSTAALEPAERTVAALNGGVRDAYPESYEFTVGATIDGSEPMLAHKVVGELDRPGYIVEVTEDDTDLPTRIGWMESAVSGLLGECGLETNGAGRR